MSETMTIIIYFHMSWYRNFKYYYKNFVMKDLRQLFPDLVSYNRFVELMKGVLLPLIEFMNQLSQKSIVTGISFVDSTTIKVCNNRRIHNHKVFKGIAKRGKSSMGWFFGFKLHLAINDRGEILSFFLTKGNIDDRDLNVMNKLTKRIFGKLFGDRGYISQKLFDMLYSKGVQLITKVKSNMKNKLMDLSDKLLLRKRSIIETINDLLKNQSQIEHTRHRSPINFLVNLISGLIAYSYLEKKPSLNLNFCMLGLES